MNTCSYCGDLMANLRRVQCGKPGCRRAYDAERARRYFSAYRVKNGTRYDDRYGREVECPGCGEVRKVRPEHMKRKGYTGMCVRCQRITARGGCTDRHKLPVLRESFDPTLTLRWREAEARLRTPPRRTDSWQLLVAGACARCGTYFVGAAASLDTAPKYCSARCLRGSAKRRHKFKIARSVRLAIYERDGWVCQLCGDPVDPNLHWSDDWAASLDHIICQSWTDEPDHSPGNLRLAHRWCNAVRNDERHYTADVLAA